MNPCMTKLGPKRLITLCLGGRSSIFKNKTLLLPNWGGSWLKQPSFQKSLLQQISLLKISFYQKDHSYKGGKNKVPPLFPKMAVTSWVNPWSLSRFDKKFPQLSNHKWNWKVQSPTQCRNPNQGLSDRWLSNSSPPKVIRSIVPSITSLFIECGKICLH